MAREGIICEANIPAFSKVVGRSTVKTKLKGAHHLSLAFRMFFLQRNNLCRPCARPYYTAVSVASTSNELEMDKNKLITQGCMKKNLPICSVPAKPFPVDLLNSP